MKPKNLAAAASLALVLLALSVPLSTADAGIPSCAKAHDNPGFGGSHVECDEKVPCGAYAELVMAAFATDADATVTGDFNCGGAGAPCAPGNTAACSGASPGPTPKSGEGTCEADSNEFWSSTVWVACAVIGGMENPPDAHKVICQLYPKFPDCSKDGGDILHDWRNLPNIRQACEEQANKTGLVLTTYDYDHLFPTLLAGRDIAGMHSTVYFADGSLVTFIVQNGKCALTFGWNPQTDASANPAATADGPTTSGSEAALTAFEPVFGTIDSALALDVAPLLPGS